MDGGEDILAGNEEAKNNEEGVVNEYLTLLDHIAALLQNGDIRKVLINAFAHAGNEQWQLIGGNAAAVDAMTREEALAAGAAIVSNAWNDFIQQYRAMDTDLPVGQELLPDEIDIEAAKMIANALYARLPQSESYIYVGQQYEARCILLKYFAVLADEAMPRCEEDREVEQSNAASVAVERAQTANFSWNSREARVLMGLFYHRVYANLVVLGEQFTLPECVGQIISAITEYNEEVTALKQAMTKPAL
jgi:hypothetical protein